MNEEMLREELSENPPPADGEQTAGKNESTPAEDGGDCEEMEPTAEDGGDCEEVEPTAEDGEVDYDAVARGDLAELKREFPELRELDHISRLDNPLRYGALRDLGLSPREAYLATQRVRRPDGRSHLSSAMPRGAGSPTGGMSSRQLAEARELFSDMSDVEIRSLYKKVTR